MSPTLLFPPFPSLFPSFRGDRVVRGTAWTALVLLAATFVAPASGQVPVNLERYDLVAPTNRIDVPTGGQTEVVATFYDLSQDSAGTLSPGSPGLPHHSVIRIRAEGTSSGWVASTMPISFDTYGGQSRDIRILFQADNSAGNPFFQTVLTVTTTNPYGNQTVLTATFMAYSPGRDTFTALVPGNYQMKPGDIQDLPVRINNNALVPRSFDIAVVSDPCGLSPATSSGNLVGPKTTEEYSVSVQSPREKFWYYYQDCPFVIQVAPSDNPAQVRTIPVSIQLNGFYVDPVWVFQATLAAAVVVLLILFVARRKARIEEAILGKPQKPWTIPVEKVYLKHLKEKDERAWYVVRHFLMEEEYRSSRLWFKDYKKATKGARKKERLILSQEKGYEAWKAKWQRRIEAPVAQADRFEARLQRKLDRKARRRHRKALGKHKVLTAKMKKAHEAQAARAEEKWAKAARKAEKRGQPLPDRPNLPLPDYPPEPRLEKAPLASHRWSRKAERFRSRRVRRQGDLEVKFEKADARRLARLRRKVRRMARRLDDPGFVAEHPLLQSS